MTSLLFSNYPITQRHPPQSRFLVLCSFTHSVWLAIENCLLYWSYHSLSYSPKKYLLIPQNYLKPKSIQKYWFYRHFLQLFVAFCLNSCIENQGVFTRNNYLISRKFIFTRSFMKKWLWCLTQFVKIIIPYHRK